MSFAQEGDDDVERGDGHGRPETPGRPSKIVGA